MQKPNWREWKHTPDVTVWQACALSLDINPRRLVPDTRLIDRYPTKGPFFLPQNFPSKEVEEEFDLRQRLLLVNLPNYTFFPTRYRDRWEGSRREGNSLVRLPEFASWAVSVVMWEGMPPELIELAIALPRTELSPPTIPPPPISDRQTLLRQRKSVTIAEAAEILTGTAGWTKQNRAAMDLIREAIQDDELEPESVHYFDEDAWTFDASRAVIDQGATTVTAANFDAWRARTFQSTESAQATDAPPQVTDEVQEQSAPSGATEVTLDGNDGQGEAATPAVRRANHDITTERGCRRAILEAWDDIEKCHGPNADGRQVLRVLRRIKTGSEEAPQLKTIQNRLSDLRKEKLIPG